jgi:hypothetical protein
MPRMKICGGLELKMRASEPVSKATWVPSGLIQGASLTPGKAPSASRSVRRLVIPAIRSRMYTCLNPLLGAGTRLLADDAKTINRPSADTLGLSLHELAAAPPTAALTS